MINEQTKLELERAISRCGGIFAEYTLPDDEYLTVEISIVELGICVSGDFEQPRYFSGEVINTPLGFVLPFDSDFTIDAHLEQVSNEITEGYLLPNDLYEGDE